MCVEAWGGARRPLRSRHRVAVFEVYSTGDANVENRAYMNRRGVDVPEASGIPTSKGSALTTKGSPPTRSARERLQGRAAAREGRVSSEHEADQIPDQILVQRVRAGDRGAYRELFQRYYQKIFALAFSVVRSREDAEDVTQDAFVKAYTSLAEFKGDSAFYTWLYRIAYNVAIDLTRKVSRRGGPAKEFQETDDYDGQEQVAAIDGPHQELYRKQQMGLINRALQTLTEEHRATIVLRELDGLSYEEIADSTGVSVGTVMSRLFYARKKLKIALSEIAPAAPGLASSSSAEESAGDSEEEAGSTAAPDLGKNSKLRRVASQIYKSMIF